MIEFAEYGYVGLFIASFLAATVVPFSSEVVFSALVFGGLDAWTCVFWATFGNWLGGLTCYWLGHLGKMEWIEKWLRIKKEKIGRFEDKFRKYGDWLAFFSFLPGVGDIIAVAAGFMRSRLWIVALSMLLGKFARYVVWMYINGLLFE
ncbi:MAG TPA: YqaA family protein [Paludibacteraceae bacterium]|nr:YqaA family protein [Paludibacteraceae bacterium]